MQIVLLNQYSAITPRTLPLYLDGPVEGGGEWQAVFMKHFISTAVNSWPDSFRERIFPHVTFFVPCLWGNDHELKEYFIKNPVIFEANKDQDSSREFLRWDLHQKDVAQNNNGLVLYGLFPENKENPRSDDLPYAFEQLLFLNLFVFLARDEEKESCLVVGKHQDFPGIDQIDQFTRIFLPSGVVEKNHEWVNSPEDFADFVAHLIYIYESN